MVDIDEKLVEKVAKVARINLNEKDTQTLVGQLNDVISHFSVLEELDVEGVKPSFHPVELKNALREDSPKSDYSTEEMLSNSSHKKDGFIKGPKAV